MSNSQDNEANQPLFEASANPGYAFGQIATALVACRRLGWTARYIGSFGDDEFGGLSRESLAGEGVDASAYLEAKYDAAMIEEIHASHIDGTFKRALRRYAKPQLLLLDEFAHEPLDARATGYLYRVVAARYGQASIVLTAHTGFTKWQDLFPSEAMAVATVDRLVDRATILRFTGKTYRAPHEVVGAPLDD